MSIKTIIIADNLVRDYCGTQPKYAQKNVNIGIREISKMFGPLKKLGDGPLPLFLKEEQKRDNTEILFFRD